MLKSILSICITATLVLFVFVMLLPTQANQLAQRVLGEAVTLNNNVRMPTTVLSDKISSIFFRKPETPSVAAGDNSPLSAVNIIDATNEQRIKAGLPPLTTNDKLEQSAQLKVEDMIKNQYFEHTSPSGKTVADLGNEVGYNFIIMGENLALGDFTDANDLLSAWMNSPEHRANILNTSYEDMGAYAAQGMYQGHLVWFAVQHFGTQRSVCPSLDTTLKGSIDSLNASLKDQEVTITTLRTEIEDPNHVQGQAYTDQITQFNSMVTTYNADLATSQQEITTYNKEVVDFNNCLSQYQVSKG
jgi:uncharacterized protein YkwD